MAGGEGYDPNNLNGDPATCLVYCRFWYRSSGKRLVINLLQYYTPTKNTVGHNSFQLVIWYMVRELKRKKQPKVKSRILLLPSYLKVQIKANVFTSGHPSLPQMLIFLRIPPNVAGHTFWQILHPCFYAVFWGE